MPERADNTGAVGLSHGARYRRAALLLAWPLAAGAANAALTAGDGEIFCPFRRLTGLPCPLCGGTHACTAFLQGDFAAAWAANPGLVPIFVLAAIVSLVLLVEAILGKRLLEPRRWSPAGYLSGVFLLAAWMWRLAV